MTDVARLTKQLVETPSHEDETAAGDEIESWLRTETDGAVERDSHGNVIARRGSHRTTPRSPTAATSSPSARAASTDAEART